MGNKSWCLLIIQWSLSLTHTHRSVNGHGLWIDSQCPLIGHFLFSGIRTVEDDVITFFRADINWCFQVNPSTAQNNIFNDFMMLIELIFPFLSFFSLSSLVPLLPLSSIYLSAPLSPPGHGQFGVMASCVWPSFLCVRWLGPVWSPSWGKPFTSVCCSTS